MSVISHVLEVVAHDLERVLAGSLTFTRLVDAPPVARLSLGSEWSGLDFVLREYGFRTPAFNLARGERAHGREEPGGYELAYSDADDVQRLDVWLGRNPDALPNLVRESFDPEMLSSLEVYPGDWSEEDRERLVARVSELVSFLRAAAMRGSSLVYVVGL